MRSGILTIMKKELARFFKDKRMVIVTVFLPGIMIYALYTFMGSAMTDMYTVSEDYVPSVYAVNASEAVAQVCSAADLEITDIGMEKADEIKNEITDQNADLLLIFPEEFDNSVAEYEISSGAQAPNIEVYYNSASTDSSAAYSMMMTLLDTYEGSLANKFDVNYGNSDFDLASDKDMAGQVFSSMLPMLMLIFLFSGCMSVAPESIAGEKERGTIATLLITPMKRSELAIGKILSLSIIALLSGASSFLGTFLSLPKLMGGAAEGLDASYYMISDYVMLFFVIISTVLLFVGLISIISAFAKTIKEATTVIMPLMLVVMLVGVTSMFGGGAKSGLVYYLIPVYNSVQSMNGIFSFSYSDVNLLVTVGVNILYTLICIFVLTKMFNSERIVYSK